MQNDCNMWKTEVVIKMYFAKQLFLQFLVNQEKLLAVENAWKIFLNKFTFNTVTFQVSFQGFCLDFKFLLLLHSRFPRACIFQNNSFSHPFMVAGMGITRQLTRRETLVLLILFTFLGCLRLAESSIKIGAMMLMGKNKVLDPTLCGRSVSGLVPEIYVSSHFFYETFK